MAATGPFASRLAPINAICRMDRVAEHDEPAKEPQPEPNGMAAALIRYVKRGRGPGVSLMKRSIIVNRSTVRTWLMPYAGIFLVALSSSGCRAVAGIFKAGIWVGVIAILALFAIVGGVAAMAKK